ncbi:unnamed protein product, partial [Effrenium voratum]
PLVPGDQFRSDCLDPCDPMGGLVPKAKKISKEEAKNMQADLMEGEDSDDEYQMEKDALRAMEAGGRDSLAAAYEAMAAKEIVYDTFADELRAGYSARLQVREAWLEEINQFHEEREAAAKNKNKLTGTAKSLRFGTAIAHKRIPGWPAGGMHEHGW